MYDLRLFESNTKKKLINDIIYLFLFDFSGTAAPTETNKTLDGDEEDKEDNNEDEGNNINQVVLVPS